jgi:hypothetical protein
MEKEVRVADVEAFKTRSGNTRYVLRDDEGNEYTTFKEPIARQAVAAEGRRARIRFHEQERDGFQNVYLDAVELLEEEEADAPDRDADQAAWDAAIEAAPWLVGSNAPKREIPPEEFFEKLKPFKDLVAEDIKEDPDETSGGRR